MYLDSEKNLFKIKFLLFLFVKWLRFCLNRFELHYIRCLFLQIKNANESSFDENKNERVKPQCLFVAIKINTIFY